MIRQSGLLLLLLAIGIPAAAQTTDLKTVMIANAIPGVSYAQIQHGRLLPAVAFGEQSPGVPATPDTLYNIASLTKPLTAEVILRLASKGVLDLDEQMAPVFVDPDIAMDPRSRLLTPRLALSHQTGFPNWRDTNGLKIEFDPGTAYRYSGEGYQYVARFAERKTGQAFEALADAYLFRSEGMQSSSYVGKPWFAGRIALPTSGQGERLKPSITEHFVAADLVYTTAGDYARFMLAVLRDKEVNGAIASERIRVQRSLKSSDCEGRGATACPLEVGPGLGWQVLVFPGHTVLMHTGKDPGLFTFAYLDKTTGDGAVILTNGDAGGKLVLPLLKQFGASAAFIAYLEARS